MQINSPLLEKNMHTAAKPSDHRLSQKGMFIKLLPKVQRDLPFKNGLKQRMFSMGEDRKTNSIIESIYSARNMTPSKQIKPINVNSSHLI